MFKTCTKCKKLQSVDNFYKQSTTKDGYQYQCRSCSIKRIKQSEKHEQIEILSSTELSARQELDSKQRLANAQLKRKQWSLGV